MNKQRLAADNRVYELAHRNETQEQRDKRLIEMALAHAASCDAILPTARKQCSELLDRLMEVWKP